MDTRDVVLAEEAKMEEREKLARQVEAEELRLQRMQRTVIIREDLQRQQKVEQRPV